MSFSHTILFIFCVLCHFVGVTIAVPCNVLHVIGKNMNMSVKKIKAFVNLAGLFRFCITNENIEEKEN